MPPHCPIRMPGTPPYPSSAGRALPPWKTSLVLALSFLGLFLISACGKKGAPEPRDPGKSFRWAKLSGGMNGPCLAFSGLLEGMYGNLDGIRMELSPVNGPDDCPGCPFVAREIVSFSPREAGFNPRTGDISFAYCPSPASAYRWRLVGLNIYASLPHAVSPVLLTGNTR